MTNTFAARLADVGRLWRDALVELHVAREGQLAGPPLPALLALEPGLLIWKSQRIKIHRRALVELHVSREGWLAGPPLTALLTREPRLLRWKSQIIKIQKARLEIFYGF
jgi:hypothetical protein